jgi:hypothetical protein
MFFYHMAGAAAMIPRYLYRPSQTNCRAGMNSIMCSCSYTTGRRSHLCTGINKEYDRNKPYNFSYYFFHNDGVSHSQCVPAVTGRISITYTPFRANNLLNKVVKTGAYKRAGKAAVWIINGQLAISNTQWAKNKSQEPRSRKQIKKTK